MKVIYTDQSYDSLEDLTDFLLEELGWTFEKLLEFRTKLLDKADALETTYNNYQQEEYLEHLGKNHRRVIEGHVKIIYRVEREYIYITDFFDSRQDPEKMKGQFSWRIFISGPFFESSSHYTLNRTMSKVLANNLAPGSPTVLSTLVEVYEDEHYPILPPDPVEAIKVVMEERGMDNRQLIPLLGTKSRVSEIMNRKKPFTLKMIYNLHRALGLPLEIFINESLLRNTLPKQQSSKSWTLAPHLLQYAMASNISGVIGSAVAAGVLTSFLG